MNLQLRLFEEPMTLQQAYNEAWDGARDKDEKDWARGAFYWPNRKDWQTVRLEPWGFFDELMRTVEEAGFGSRYGDLGSLDLYEYERVVVFLGSGVFRERSS